jgi:hypothetical protein
VTKDDAKDRAARAQRLRKSIDAAVKGEPSGPPATPESPREFIHRKMTETPPPKRGKK